jgi:hypothetical protein
MTASPANDSKVRLQHIARRIHALGPRPLYELLRELVAGADALDRIEVYGRLDADVVRALGGAEFPPLLSIRGGRRA